MKKYLSLVLISFFCLCVFSQTKPKVGDGSKNSPYQIGNAQELLWLAGKVNGTLEGEYSQETAYAILTDDIDMKNVCGDSIGSWNPIGTYDHPYRGSFHGKGHSISNFYIYDTCSTYLGLFGYARDCKISNLNISGHISSKEGEKYIGTILSYSESPVLDSCSSNVAVDVILDEYERITIGGIIGFTKFAPTKDTSVSNCNFTGSISVYKSDDWAYGMEYSYIGGIVGQASYSFRMSNCTNEGLYYIEPEEIILGGMVGETDGNYTIINKCHNASNLKSGYCGGILGLCSWNPDIINCYNTGKIQGRYIAGGILGSGNGNIINCYNTKEIRGEGSVGGIVARGNNLSIHSSYNEGDISYIENGDTENHNSIFGGIAGDIINTDVKECYNKGLITVDFIGGGIVGHCSLSTIEKCYNIGKIEDDASSYLNCIGGIVGEVDRDSKIIYCYNKADISLKNSAVWHNAGGICGSAVSLYMQYCYSIANITTATTCIPGGLVGNFDNWNYASNSYSYGSLITNIEPESGVFGWFDPNQVNNEVKSLYYFDPRIDKTFENLEFKTMEAYKSGEVCYLLNGSDSTVWYQTLNVDPYPVLDPTHGKVLYDEEKGVYYNYPDIIYSAVDQKENVKETTSLVTFVVNRQVIVIGVDSFRIFNMLGHDVTASNGSLADGVYVVVADGNVAKVIVK